MTGKVSSLHHNVFHRGSKKEVQRLKYGNKYGPIKEWPSEQVQVKILANFHILQIIVLQISKLLEEEILPVAREHDSKYRMTYALDVLLPEVS